MKTPTLYVILDINGKAYAVADQKREAVELCQLLEDGWRPMSETSFGAAAAVLIRLERDPEGQLGFGFGK